MSLILNNGTVPEVTVKTWGPGPVSIGAYEVSPEDFATMVEYVMTNADLGPGDPRAELRDRVSRMARVPGRNPGGERLEVYGWAADNGAPPERVPVALTPLQARFVLMAASLRGAVLPLSAVDDAAFEEDYGFTKAEAEREISELAALVRPAAGPKEDGK